MNIPKANVLAIDQGTTNTKALLIAGSGEILARASIPLATQYPHPGWAEQSAEAIWHSVETAIAQITATGLPIAALAIANQRETLVVWDAATSRPLCPAILWQCRRTAQACAALMHHNPEVTALTGLGINPLFPASKLAWVLQNIPEARPLLHQNRLRAGTVDAWLLWNLTQGHSFATDHSNASRTQLFDTETLQFSPALAEIFRADITCLPNPLPSNALFGTTRTTTLPMGTPIHAMMGDSHAALYGHGIRQPGTVKATYGTGSSLMTLTPTRTTSTHGLSGTVAWTDHQSTAYALEGNITVSAQAAAFMAGLLGLTDAQALSTLAQSVPDSAGVSFIPALAGLGAPHWNDRATGTITGMTHATTPAHLARATFDAIALQVADVFRAMEADQSQSLTQLLADGGASSNDFLMQLQADILQKPIQRAAVEEIGAIGVAAMAFTAMGQPMSSSQPEPTRFTPNSNPNLQPQWQAALAKACL